MRCPARQGVLSPRERHSQGSPLTSQESPAKVDTLERGLQSQKWGLGPEGRAGGVLQVERWKWGAVGGPTAVLSPLVQGTQVSGAFPPDPPASPSHLSVWHLPLHVALAGVDNPRYPEPTSLSEGHPHPAYHPPCAVSGQNPWGTRWSASAQPPPLQASLLQCPTPL